MNKLIITVAPVGNVVTEETNPLAPLTIDRLIEDIRECAELGAAVVHIHARDEEKYPTCRRDVYEEIVRRIHEEKINIIVQLSTGVRGGENTVECRGQMLDVAGAQMSSLSVGSSNFAASINANSPQLIKGLAERIYANGLVPELECFDVSMVENALWMRDRGILKDPLYFNMVMNVPGSLRGTEENLRFMVSKLPEGSMWNMSAIGKAHSILIPRAIEMGGNIRTGIEDVIQMPRGHKVSNRELVRFCVDEAARCGRGVASYEEAAEMLGVKSI